MKPEVALERFEVFLRSKKLRMTRPRRDILLAAWDTHSHFTAEEMFTWVQGRDSNAARATVYRTLNLLVEGEFLASMNNGQGTQLYEHILGHSHHDHMICRGCERVLEFRSEEIEQLQEEIAERNNFLLVHHVLRLEGYCPKCRTDEGKEV